MTSVRQYNTFVFSDSRQDRAVSPVIGFILIFGIAIVGWSVWQTTAVPAQNEQTEFDHNQQAQGELLNVRDSALRTGTTGVEQTTTIQVGADYARRALGVNLATSSGRVRLRDPAPDNGNTLYIMGANAADAETKQYFDGNVTVSTKSLEYHPKYGQYHGAPDTVIAGGLGAVINTKLATGEPYNFSIGDQVLVSDRTITLVTFNGSLDESKSGESATVTVETEPLSVSERSITVQNQSEPINLTIPTQIADTAAWNQSGFESERTGGQVINVTQLNSNYIRVLLEPGTYSLRMMRVGLGSKTVDPGPEYITDVDTPTTVPDDSSSTFTYEVRDTFNNPETGVQVNASILRGGGQSLSVVGEDDVNQSAGDRVTANTSNGQVVFSYTAPNVTTDRDVRLNVTILDNSTPRERVMTEFTVFDTDGSGSGNGSNDSGAGTSAGQGGTTDYAKTKNQTVSSKGGVWKNISGVDHIHLDNATLALTSPSQNAISQESRYLSVGLVITDDSGEKYEIIIGDKAGLEYKYQNGSDSWNSHTATVYKQIGTDEPQKKYDGKKLDAAQLDNTLPDKPGKFDILDSASYTGSTGWLSGLQSMLANPTGKAQIYFTQMHGRVEVEMGPDPPSASDISTQSGSTPSGNSEFLEFDLKVADGKTKEIDGFEITTPANSNANANDVDKLYYDAGPEVELTPSNTGGANRTGTAAGTYQVDSGKESMDTNAIFKNGNVLAVKMGKANKTGSSGNVKLKYETTSQSNSDITVTLYFTDGTTHEVYLKVTNVNS